MTTTVDWCEFRRQMCLDSGSTYLNTGSFAPLPVPVWSALVDLRRRLATSPSDFLWRQAPPLLGRARQALARFLNVPSGELLLLGNVTAAINLVVRSLDVPAGSEVLLTNQEYGAMRYCWRESAARRGWRLREVPIPVTPGEPRELVEAVFAAVTPRTRILFFSHVTSPTGLVLPAAELCRRAAEAGVISVVDGAHAPGMMLLDLAQIGADYYGGNCHKWLLAPAGCGFLHVRRQARLEPLVTSWGAEYDPGQADEDSGWGASYWARNFEFHGTQDRTPTMVLPDVLDFRSAFGESALYERMRELSTYAAARLGACGWECVTPTDAALRGAIVACAVPSVDPVKARDWLWHTHRIEAPFTTAAGKCFLRVSTAPFNTFAEIDRLAEAVSALPAEQLR